MRFAQFNFSDARTFFWIPMIDHLHLVWQGFSNGRKRCDNT